MEDEAILLKIKRDFSENEAVQSLLKIIASLEIEIGVLKSEKDELNYELLKISKLKEEGGLKPKKQWHKDELVEHLNDRFVKLSDKHEKTTKLLNEWRNKYFSLLIKK